MKKNIHPAYSKLQVKCTNCKKLDIFTFSTLTQEIFYNEKCMNCHTAFTKDTSQIHTSKRTNKHKGRKEFSLAQLAK